MNRNHYPHLLIMAVLSFASMYMLMYAMVNSFENVYSSVNQVYMAGLMTAPMMVIELLVMRGMYRDKGGVLRQADVVDENVPRHAAGGILIARILVVYAKRDAGVERHVRERIGGGASDE
jgi:hypothetical protein